MAAPVALVAPALDIHAVFRDGFERGGGEGTTNHSGEKAKINDIHDLLNINFRGCYSSCKE